MKKVFIALALSMIVAFGGKASDPNVIGDIVDWGYVENGMIYAKVYVENAEGINITPAGSEASVELVNGLNTIMVPEYLHTYSVKANSGYYISEIKIGGNKVEVSDNSATIDCANPASVYIVAQSTTLGINDVSIQDEGEIKYVDLSGREVKNPKHGIFYIMISGSKITKIKY